MTLRDRNYECKVTGCGKGYLRTDKGIRVRTEGNTTIFESDGVE